MLNDRVSGVILVPIIFIDMETKMCNKCGKNLDISKFKIKSGKPYYICKDCEKEYMYNYRKLNKCRINEQHAKYIDKYKQEPGNKDKLKKYFREYQRKKLCIDESKFRGPNKLAKGKHSYTKSQIIKMSIYGLTPQQFDSLPSKCEVCGSTFRLCIDHDHTTGNYRGVLCNNCNLALGHLHDNPEVIAKLLNYINNKKSVKTI